VRVTPLLVILIPTALVAAPKPGDEGTPEYQTAADLVRQLGDPRFATREAAAKKLVEMGEAAVPAIAAGIKSADEEVRARAAALLPKAVAVGWRRKAEAFRADSAAHRDLPLLAKWEKLTGKPDNGTRKLYADMLAAEGPLLEQAAGDQKVAAAALAARAKELLAGVRTGGTQVEATAGDVAGVLFVQWCLNSPAEPAGGDGRTEPLYLLANPATRTALGDKDVGPSFRKLVVAWYGSRPADEHMAGLYFTLLAHRQPFSEADPILIRLATKQKNVQLRWVAMEALGRSGSAAAVGALTDLLNDTTTMYDNLDNKEVGHQDRDCALAALVNGQGMDPKGYKLHEFMSANFWFGGTADTVTVRLYGFASNADRDAGIKKWKAEAAGKK
jgi:HEAT repeat protein